MVLHAILIDGRMARVVDSPTQLHRMPLELVRRMCADLGPPQRGALGDAVRIVPITQDRIVSWDAPAELQAQPLLHCAYAAKRAAKRGAA